MNTATPAARRPVKEVIGLGLANGIFIGAGLLASHPAHGVLAALGAGTCMTVAYLFVKASRTAEE